MQLLVATASLSCLFILVVNIEFIRPGYRSAIEVTGLKIRHPLLRTLPKPKPQNPKPVTL